MTSIRLVVSDDGSLHIPAQFVRSAGLSTSDVLELTLGPTSLVLSWADSDGLRFSKVQPMYIDGRVLEGESDFTDDGSYRIVDIKD